MAAPRHRTGPYRTGPHRRLAATALRAACLGLLLGGCGSTIRPDFESPEPAARNAAIVDAAARNDRSAVPQLVRMLESDDPATRSLAISALERLTGQTHGYEAWDTPLRREEAIARWRHELGRHAGAP